MGAMGFLVTIVTAMDMMTTTQLKNSPYFECVISSFALLFRPSFQKSLTCPSALCVSFRYSFKSVRQNKDVQELLGTQINSPWRVTVKKHKRRFQLNYSLKGERGNWAHVIAASTIDGKRDVIDESCFRYIVVQPTTLRKICFGVVTDGLYDLAAIVGKEYWFSETEEEARRRRETEIVVVDRVEVHSSSPL